MVYEEKIELVDGVSGPAQAATAAVDNLEKSVRRAQKSLADFAGVQIASSPFDSAAASAEKFAQSLTNAVGLAKELAAVKGPTIGAPVAASPAPVSPTSTIVRPAPVAPVSPTSPASPAAPVAPTAPAPAFGPIKVTADTASAVAQFKVLTSGVKAAEGAMTRAQALGDQVGFDKAAEKATAYKTALAQLPSGTKEAAEAGKGLTTSMWNARNAMDVGRQSIGAAIAGMKSAFASLAQGDVKGAIQGVTDAVAGMAKMLDLVVPGLGEVVSAVVSIAGGLFAATAGLVVSGAKFAVAANQGKQAMLSMFDAMGGGLVTGEQLDNMLSDLSDRIRISKDDLVPLTQAFLQMGVTGVDSLEKLTLAAISAEAITKGGAAAFTDLQKKIQAAAQTSGTITLNDKMIKALGDSGVKVDDLTKGLGLTSKALAGATVDANKLGDVITDAVIARGAKPLERMASSFDAIKKKFMQDIGDLFEDIDVGPFMKEVKELFAIFGQGTSSGQVLKAGIGGFFKEVFEIATKVVPLVRGFLLDLVIYGLKAYIALKPIVKSIREFFESTTGSAVLSTALDAIGLAFKAIGVVVLVVVGLFITITSLIIAFDVAIVAAVASIVKFGANLLSSIGSGISGAWNALKNWVAGAGQIGTDFVNGLIGGVTGGIGGLGNAVKGLANSALNALTGKQGFDSHSPSLKTTAIGGFVADGLAVGMDAGAPDVHGAATGMAATALGGVASAASGVSPGEAAARAAVAAGSGSSDNSKSVVVNIDTIEINGAGKGVTEITQEAMATAWEQAAELMAA